jgi:N-acetylglucosamine-6-phosphate deacetylase
MPLTRWFAGGEALIDGRMQRADLLSIDGVIAAIVEPGGSSTAPSAGMSAGSSAGEVVDCTEQVVSPGFVDLQCNGAVGFDITSDPDSIASVAEALPRFGVTAFLPTVVTSPPATRRAAIESLGRIGRQGAQPPGAQPLGAQPLGLHFEGPMISPDHLGAHRRRNVAALDEAEIDEWIESGAVRLVTLAPELDGARPMIEHLAAGGIVVSGGHTAMDPDDLAAARSVGLTAVTHLFNAMAPFSHRSPGPIGAVLADDRVVAGIICDGVHVDPVAVRMAWRNLGPERVVLVSDASPALGMPFGRMELAGITIVHDESGVRTVDGTLAGSALALDQAVRNLVAFAGCPLEDALTTVTSTPADLLGLTDRGRLRVGAHADLTILDRAGRVVATVVGGETVFAS